MSVDVLSEIVINRERVAVADYASDPDNAPKWYVNIKSVKWETAKPHRVRSRIAFAANFFGRELSYTLTAKPRRAVGVRRSSSAVHGPGDEKGERQGPSC